tara:strand:- start:378 stop:626 length:249 start_codon:yes stop_codon:yes gene_type:complete
MSDSKTEEEEKPKKHWAVHAGVQGSAFLGIWPGDTKEEAIEAAEKNLYLGLCHECCNKGEDLEIQDGTVTAQETDEECEEMR